MPARLSAVPRPGDDVASLLEALVAGRVGAADEFFRRFAPLVASVIVNTLGRRPEVPDLVNDVFVMALRDVGRVQSAAALQGWLTAVTVNVCRVFLRSQRRRAWLRFFAPEALPDVEATPTAEGPEGAVVKAVYEVLDTLPAEERLAVALHDLEGLSLAAMAEAMRVSLATGKRRLSAGRARFAEKARGDRRLTEWLEEHP
ncbi:MAG: sigma-70 family RNA polymerase sigma factor [Myxococcaceae bacterium]|nr:sigma-70 family RNA polymerase sigma factor [Myxococcaceae bacterium]